MTIPSLPLSSQLHDRTKFATQLHDHTKFATQLHDNAKFDYKRLCGSEAIQINIHWHFKPLLWPWPQQFKFGCKKISTSENVPETVIFWLWITYCNFQTRTVRHCWILGAEIHTHGTLKYKAQLWQCHSRWENPHGHIYMPNTKVSATIWKSGNIQWIWKWISGAGLTAWKISLTNLPEYVISVPVFWYGNQLEFKIIINILWKNMHAFTQLAIQTHILHFSLKMHTAKGAEESLNLFTSG